MVGQRRTLTALLAGALFTLSTGAAAPETLIERGAYLVNGVMACANCHTPRDANGPIPSKTLAGGRVFETPAFKAWSSNLTPGRVPRLWKSLVTLPPGNVCGPQKSRSPDSSKQTRVGS